MKHEKAVKAAADWLTHEELGVGMAFTKRVANALAAFLRAVEASGGMTAATDIDIVSHKIGRDAWRAMADKLADELEGK